MEVLKTEDSAAADLATFNSAPVKAELDYWERLIFSFDMDKEPTNSSGNNNAGNRRRPRPATQTPTIATDGFNDGSSRLTSNDHDILTQFAAGGMAQPGGVPHGHHTYDSDLLAQTMQGPQGFNPYVPPAASFPPNFMPHENMGQQHIQMPPQGYGWPQQPVSPPQSQYDPLQHSHHYNPGASQFTYGGPPQQQSLHINTNTSFPPPASTSQSVGAASPSMSPSDTTGESGAATEDKRRRNTAASARFRTKKKQRSLNLERSVSDLTGRAEELEREASELRKENVWLKEIVILKGRSLAGTSRDEGGSRNRGDDDSDSDSDQSDSARKKKKGKGRDKADK